jgi:hypothetical protein
MDTTYRVIDLADRENVGHTAATPELAKLAAGRMERMPSSRFALEQTDWDEEYGKPKRSRSIIIEAEDPSERWNVGP